MIDNQEDKILIDNFKKKLLDKYSYNSIIYHNLIDSLSICKFSQKMYNLFINNVIFEPKINENNDNNNDELYYLGVYYQHVKGEYNISRKYYTSSIKKYNNDYALFNIGLHYEDNYDFYTANLYYLAATERGNKMAMSKLARYYHHIEKNYDLAIKYYLMLIGNDVKSSVESDIRSVNINFDMQILTSLGICYYEIQNYVLMKKYYLAAIEKGDCSAAHNLGGYYNYNNPSWNDIRVYILTVIEGNIRFNNVDLFYAIHTKKMRNTIVNLYCSFINKISEKDLDFCSCNIIDYIRLHKLKNIMRFVVYIRKLYNMNNKVKDCEHKKKIILALLDKESTQLLMEYFNIIYDKYLKKKYAPGGKGYIKAEKEFYSTASKIKK